MGWGFSRDLMEATGEDWSRISVFNDVLQRLADRRVGAVHVEGVFLRSKIAWKIGNYQQVILRRTVMLAEGCAAMWNAGNSIGALLCARALMETAAVFLDFRNQLRRLSGVADVDGIEALVANRTFGHKREGWPREEDEKAAVNVITMVGKLDKLMPSASSTYGLLSEFCHPNYLGVVGLFAVLNEDTGSIDFLDSKHATHDLFSLVFLPFMLIRLVESALDDVDGMLDEIAALHEAHVAVDRDGNG